MPGCPVLLKSITTQVQLSLNPSPLMGFPRSRATTPPHHVRRSSTTPCAGTVRHIHHCPTPYTVLSGAPANMRKDSSGTHYAHFPPGAHESPRLPRITFPREMRKNR
ncbi:hypothetical protein HMPREF0290_0497 [Corynebacterium efficiens YS-314]|nr:hypothetical protein HMPREF0290_0497 [Corynebacterium efficiens YS-314]